MAGRPHGDNYSIVPSTKAGDSFGIPESLSGGGEGFQQQTFLGASIRNVTLNAGFGDSSTTLNVDLVNDEYNKSDGTAQGLGDDVYHNGQYDTFSPPPVGSPVFFKLGKYRATVNDAFYKTFNDLYGNGKSAGTNHLAFGGILQSYIQNRGPSGNPLYSVQVVDPREILSNVVLLLNNYAGTTFNNKNMFNIYGFLEYNPTQALKDSLAKAYPYVDLLRKGVNPDGSYGFAGYDLRSTFPTFIGPYRALYENKFFPITGTGFARRGPQGMPFYRVAQGLKTLLGMAGPLPQDYIDAGFGGYINFRGHNYLVDLSGLKALPDYYFFDFDNINLLDFCLEIGDVTSSELFISLLPIINHPACSYYYEYNNQQMSLGNSRNIISGIIRVDSIDKSIQPQYGTIKTYIDNLTANGFSVVNQDVGFELSNITTDKFVVGAQEIDMHYFSSNADRDDLELRKQIAGESNIASYLISDQWRLSRSYKQQILPYYGLIGNSALSIPRGFGSYQQIVLDASTLNANGVGNYYIATEIELRAAAVSYERWSEFLLMYNDLYMESIELDDALEGAALAGSPEVPGPIDRDPRISNNYAVTVPRCVFNLNFTGYGDDGLLIEGCNPPYGYPLYYKRAVKIGVQGAGLSDLNTRFNSIITSIATLKGSGDDQFETVLNSEWQKFSDKQEGSMTQAEKDYRDFLIDLINNASSKADAVGLLDNTAGNLSKIIKVFPRLSKKTKENSLRVYNFVKRIADECLGKKFLVKIPREVNLFYNPKIKLKSSLFANEYYQGPFGFRPRKTNSIAGYEFTPEFQSLVRSEANRSNSYNSIQSFLTLEDGRPRLFNGALEVNYNPILEKYEFNYSPDRQGGYVDFDLSSQSLGINQGLVPQDLTNFLTDGNRLSAYVRFDNSQNLTFENIGPENLTQQSIVAGHFVPDVSNTLDNLSVENSNFIDFEQNESKSRQIAFVKCEVDEKLYMPPLSTAQQINVHGSTVRDIGQYSIPRKIWNKNTCQYDDGFSYYQSHYVPDIDGFSSINQSIQEWRDINGNKNQYIKSIPIAEYPIVPILEHYLYKNGTIFTETLDTDHVYALITLPGKVLTTADSRFRDGMMQKKDPAFFKHTMGMDVVKLPEFALPGIFGTPHALFNDPDYAGALDPDAINNAISAYNKTMETFFPLPFRLNIVAPSPVYPDLVALPLLSKERCYGPWVSSKLDVQAQVYDNIAGKVEFIKDENLSPWNYNGYDLMNQAGILQAQFSNSLLLSSERGGFAVADAPVGISLGKYLLNLGPLVTNISIDVNTNGIQTTYKMDLYTAKFGKLQKQKEEMVRNISRERQKIKDERNALIRKNIGKNQTNVNYSSIYQEIKNQTLSIKPDEYSPGDKGFAYSPDGITLQVVPREEVLNVVQNGQWIRAGERQSINTSSTVAAATNTQLLGNGFSDGSDPGQLARPFSNAAHSTFDEMFAAASYEQHPNMPTIYPNPSQDTQNLYNDFDGLGTENFSIS